MAQKEIVTVTMGSYVTYLRIAASLVNSLCSLCPLYSFVLLRSVLRILVKNDAGLSKQCMKVKMMVGLKCQNGVGMSKFCRFFLSKCCRFRRTRLHHLLSTIYIGTTNTSLIIECSKRVIKQSEELLILTVKPKI